MNLDATTDDPVHEAPGRLEDLEPRPIGNWAQLGWGPAAIHRIVADESGHAQFGWWFLDWADARLSDDDRAYLAGIARDAIRAFAPLFERQHARESGLGVVDCDRYEQAFRSAVAQVTGPLAERGIEVPSDSLTPLIRNA